MKIEIRLNEKCNYNCPYCEDLHRDTPFVLLDFDNLERVFKQFEDTWFFIYGGEPTLHPEIIELVNLCKKYSNQIIIQTNGSNPSVIKDLINEYSNIIVNYSYHPSSTTLGNFMKVIEKDNLGEIAVMDMPRKNIKTYSRLKLLHGEKVQYYPILPKQLDNLPSTKHLRSLEDDPDFHLVENDWAFQKMHHGFSNYEIWRDNILSYERICNIEFSTIFIQDNIVYNCFNDIFNANINGTKVSKYTHNPVKKACHNRTCYFDSQCWDSV